MQHGAPVDLIVFILLSIFELGAATLVVLSKRLVRAVLWFAMSMVIMAGIYILLLGEFVAVIQALVYAGAVPVVILFGVMLTRERIEAEAEVG